ncbi:hypothetical protein [Nocardioides sp.]|uniref:hypothetical protein n=1 Tax=Nocardioides sp. TaxID=35761 RepID=UPI0019B33B15|nr:hypothetical protein [Nocardioides sp.]MBC7275627.1 hypothetical protein [Nocardioides sp.]
MSESPVVIPFDPYDGATVVGQATNLLLFKDPFEFARTVRAGIQALKDGVKDGKNAVEKKIDALGEQELIEMGFIKITGGDLLGAAIPGLGPLAHVVREGLKRQLDQTLDGVDQAIDEVEAALDKFIDLVFGDPGRLMSIAMSYRQAANTIEQTASDAEGDSKDLGKYWETGGSYIGFEAFELAYEDQIEAMRLFPERLRSAADLLSQLAEMIKRAWSGVAQAVKALEVGIVDTIASAFDGGNLVLMEIGPILSFVARGKEFINGCLQPLQEVNMNAETSTYMSWTALSDAGAGVGTDWLWPALDQDNSAELSDPDQWKMRPNMKDSRQ